MEAWLQLIGGLVMLLLGAEALVRGAVALALRLRISPITIGLTLVALGTSLPELVIGLKDAYSGSGGIAVGGLFGSNVFNIGAILGVSALIYPVQIESRTLRLEYPFMVMATLAVMGVAHRGEMGRAEGMLLIGISVAFVLFLMLRVRIGARRRAAQAAQATGEFASETIAWPLIVLFVIGGGTLVHFGSDVALLGARALARQWGWSDHVIGLTIVAFGTSAPELAVSVVAALRKRTEVAIGNIIGSCIFNLTLIFGCVVTVHPLSLEPQVLDRDGWWVLGLTILMLPLMVRGKSLGRLDGALLLATFATYYVLLLLK